MRRALVRVWAAPWSLVGLVLGAGFSYRRRTRGILLCWGAGWPAKLGWGYRAITLGHVVLAVDEPDDRLLRHELVHVAQFERWGPLMGPAYLVAALRARAKGGHPYRDNRFEVAARAGEGI
ncbi:MAG: DUF4157 domain-containing protein [Actinomycetota bacterium]|nr:DUF4157 domain-containing protein [Actinomycetota bacterium]